MGKLIGRFKSAAKSAYGKTKDAYRSGKETARKTGVALGEARKVAVGYGSRVNSNTQTSNLLTGNWEKPAKHRTKRKHKGQTIVVINNSRGKKRKRKQQPSFSLY